MKHILQTLLICFLFFACNNEPEILIEENPVINTSVSGILQCVNNNGLSQISIELTGSDGEMYATTTDANGAYSFENLPEGSYIINFTNPAIYQYSEEEYETILEDLRDVVLGARDKTNVDHIAYNLINYEDGLTTYDIVLFDKLKTGENLLEEVQMPWRFVLTNEIEDNDEITDQLEFDLLESIQLDITAIAIGDISGIACN